MISLIFNKPGSSQFHDKIYVEESKRWISAIFDDSIAPSFLDPTSKPQVALAVVIGQSWGRSRSSCETREMRWQVHVCIFSMFVNYTELEMKLETMQVANEISQGELRDLHTMLDVRGIESKGTSFCTGE